MSVYFPGMKKPKAGFSEEDIILFGVNNWGAAASGRRALEHGFSPGDLTELEVFSTNCWPQIDHTTTCLALRQRPAHTLWAPGWGQLQVYARVTSSLASLNSSEN